MDDDPKRGANGDAARRQLTPQELDPEPTSVGGMLRKWPKVTFCIISNEFCERFSFYGMRTVLTLYLINILNFSDNGATIFFHAFIVASYTSPLFGSTLADGYIGKFWTIFSVSIVYALGQVILAVGSTFKKESSLHPYIDLFGLFVIAMGTGGIKPCVSAFGGEQFPQHYLKMISIYFSVFYFSINAGSTISTFLTPVFRALPCMGNDSCFPLAFGVPAILMIVATVVFMLGSVHYKKYPPKENVMARVLSCIWTALGNRRRSKVKRGYWLEHYLDTHSCASDPKCIALQKKQKKGAAGKDAPCAQRKFVADVKSLIRVTVMMSPVPMFWALYDQQGSRWVIQAVQMDAQLTSGYALLPDQMGTLNAVLIMVFIPIFQAIIYPFFEYIGIRTTSLRRIIVGGLLAALSFVICAFVQLSVNNTLPTIPNDNQAFMTVINAFPNNTGCVMSVLPSGFPESSRQNVFANSSLVEDKVNKIKQLYEYNAKGGNHNRNFSVTGTGCTQVNGNYPIETTGGKSGYLAVTPSGWLKHDVKWDKPTEGEGQFSMSITFAVPQQYLPDDVKNWTNWNHYSNNTYDGYFVLCAYDKKSGNYSCDPRKGDSKYYVWKKDDEIDTTPLRNLTTRDDILFHATYYDYKDIKPGTYKLFYANYYSHTGDRTPSASQISVSAVSDGTEFQIKKMGGVYAMIVSVDPSTGQVIFTQHTIVHPNHVNILWQVPQYVVITAAEILFSITGLEFAYAEAAPSMKSVVQAIWLVTVAFGDLIIIIIAIIDPFTNLAIEMFVYAGAMVVVIGVFILLSIFYYEYADYTKEEDQDESGSESDDCESCESIGRENLAFTSTPASRPLGVRYDDALPGYDNDDDTRF